MGTLRLIIKQMRQRALGTWLTLLSVLLGVALAISILLLRDAGQALFGQTEYGYDVMVGVGQGSSTQLVMNTVYHIDKSPGNVPYWVYEQLNTKTRRPAGSKEFDMRRHVKLAVPTAVGDSYEGRPIIGTLPKFFISLSELEKDVDDLIQAQIQLDGPAITADGQAAVASTVRQWKGRIAKTDREQVPLVDAQAGPSKWQYGKPATEECDAAAAEFDQAAASLRAANSKDAAQHRKTGLDLLNRILGAIAGASGPLEYIPGKTYQLAEGRIFHPWKFEAVIGSEVAQGTTLKLGGQFHATHGNPGPHDPKDIHPEMWQVVGVLKPTHTAADRCLYIPLITDYCIAEHDLENQSRAHNGQAVGGADVETPKYHLVYGDELLPDLPHTKDFISLDIPADKWEVSAILVQSRGGVTGGELLYFIQNGGISGIQAVNPAEVMRQFFDTFLKNSAYILLIISALVSIVAGVGILVSIYNSVSARTREIAILRALGATRGRVLTLICAEAVLIGLSGAVIGLLVGHGLGGIASFYLNNYVGQGFNWITVRWDEWGYLVVVVAIAFLAGLVPALKAYQTPVATNLVAG
jgi:putative ABC transport system permease protein